MSHSELIARLLSRLVQYAVSVVGMFIGLGILGLDKTVTSLLAGAGVVGLAIGLAFQDLAASFLAGVFMGVRRSFEIGDLVETNGYLGHVRKLNLRNTLLETFSGQQVLIPNKQVFEQPLVNYTAYGKRRVEITVGVSFDADLAKVTRVATDAISALDFRAPESAVDVFALEYGASAVQFSIRYWIVYPGEKGYFDAIHDGVLAVREAFERHQITIPFPIRTLDFGRSPEGPGGAHRRRPVNGLTGRAAEVDSMLKARA